MPSQPSRKRVAPANKQKAGKSTLVKKLKKNEKDLAQNERRLARKAETLKKTKWVDDELQEIKKQQKEKNVEEEEVEEMEDDIEKELAEEEEEEVEEEEAGEEDEEDEEEEVDLKDLPVIPLSTSNKAKLRQIRERPAKKDDNQKSSVVYLGHLPFGFFEWQLKDFMEQFGEVQRLYISKNKKTGRSRGYGFIEFLYPEVAEIVADTMHDYLMFKKRLVCKVLPQIKAKNLPWPTNQITVPKPFAAQRQYADKYNNEKKPITLSSLVDKERRKRKKLAANNIDYTFDGYESLMNKLKTEEKAVQEKIAAEKEEEAEKEQEKKWAERKKEKAAQQKAIRTEKEKKDAKQAKAEAQKQQKKRAREEKEEKEKEKEMLSQLTPKERRKLKAKAKEQAKKAEKAKAKLAAEKEKKKAIRARKMANKKAKRAAATESNTSSAADASTNPPPAKKPRQEA